MSNSPFKYDIAFSFLAQDEQLATQLNDLLTDRYNTFLYSERQTELAGTDGEKTFSAVFLEEARFVVVLYRQGWGESAWTRIEQTAIRNRGFEDAYEFAKFIALDTPPMVPKWVPKAQLWINFNRWGLQGTAAAIEARLIELGGEATVETALDRAARLSRALKFDGDRKKFLGSNQGVEAAEKAYQNFQLELSKRVTEINSTGGQFNLELKTNQRQIVLLGLRPALEIEWIPQYSNTLEGAVLEITHWDGHPPFLGTRSYEKIKRRGSSTLEFDISPTGAHIWKQKVTDERSLTSEDLAEWVLKDLMEHASPKRE